MGVCVSKDSGGRWIGSGPSIGWIRSRAAPKVAEERAKSNVEDHIASLSCEKLLTIKDVNGDSGGPSNHVCPFKSHSVGTAMIEDHCESQQGRPSS